MVDQLLIQFAYGVAYTLGTLVVTTWKPRPKPSRVPVKVIRREGRVS